MHKSKQECHLAVKSYCSRGKRTITAVSDLFKPIAQIGAVGTELPVNAFNEHGGSDAIFSNAMCLAL